MQPLLFCQYFFKFFYFFFLSFVHYYYMQIILNDAYFLNFFVSVFLSLILCTLLLYTIDLKMIPIFFKILLFSISCNLYIGLTMPFSSPKKFLNFLVFSIKLKNSYIIQENYQLH